MPLPENPGFAVSGGVHIGLLALALFLLSQSPQFDAAQESVPVEILSAQQFNQIVKGEKTAAGVKPRQRAEKIADLAELTPQPSPSEAPKDVSAPPPPLKRQTDPGQAEPQEAPKPPEHGMASPPPRPAQETAKPAPKSEPVTPSVAPPKPPVNEAEETATPEPAQPKPVAPPKKPAPKFKPDQLAKLLDQEKQKEKQKPAAKPRSGEEAAEPQQKFDPGDIAKFLNEAPQRKQASGHDFSQVASLGSPTASATKMSPSLWDQLDGLLQEQYKRCWNFAGLGGQQKYIPEIHVQYTLDGSLIGQPVLLNPPSDPNLRALAESAMRAVRRCDPLRIPSQYQLYYEQWKGRIVRFDPEEML